MAKFDEVEECRHSLRDVRSGNWFYLLEDNLVISVKTLNEYTVYTGSSLAGSLLYRYAYRRSPSIICKRKTKQNKIGHSLKVYQLRTLLTSNDSCTLWGTTWLFSRIGIGLYILIRKGLQDIVSKKCKAQDNCFVWFFGQNILKD